MPQMKTQKLTGKRQMRMRKPRLHRKRNHYHSLPHQTVNRIDTDISRQAQKTA